MIERERNGLVTKLYLPQRKRGEKKRKSNDAQKKQFSPHCGVEIKYTTSLIKP